MVISYIFKDFSLHWGRNFYAAKGIGRSWGITLLCSRHFMCPSQAKTAIWKSKYLTNIHSIMFCGSTQKQCLAVSDALMEAVFRMTYKNLYFFKKTLKETGQLTLADNVIVRLHDGSELELNDVWNIFYCNIKSLFNVHLNIQYEMQFFKAIYKSCRNLLVSVAYNL